MRGNETGTRLGSCIALFVGISLVAAQAGQPAKTASAIDPAIENRGLPVERQNPAPQHMQSDEVRAFRKTAIPVAFPSQGLTLRGWIYRPQGQGPFPSIIWNHGSEKNPTAHPELGLFYTRNGYVVFLPVRHGHNPSPGDYIGDLLNSFRARVQDRSRVEEYAVDLQEEYDKDVVAALKWLREQPYVDGDRIAVTGCSYGGIQTLLTAEKGEGLRAAIPFAPGAMSWSNTALQRREKEAVRRAGIPLFLIQANNDYSIGPSEALGPMLRGKGGLNRAKIYPAFGSTHQEGHAGFACWEEGIAIWGGDVIKFLDEAGMTPRR